MIYHTMNGTYEIGETRTGGFNGLPHKISNANSSTSSNQKTDRDLMDEAIAESRRTSNAAVAASQAGVNAVLSQKPAVDNAVQRMFDAADQMRPIADTLKSEGAAMFDSGTKVTSQALQTLGVGLGFLNMDASSSPIVGEALKLYDQFDPDKYVAMAAQDAQNAQDNATAQAGRNMSRMGVNPTSGAYAAAQANLQKYYSAAKAAIMQRAREQGKTEQAKQFQSLVADNAKTFLDTGGQLASIGSSMRSAGTDAQNKAAGVLGDAGTLAGNAGTISLKLGDSLASAYNALAATTGNQADVALKGEQLRVSAVNGGRGGGATVIDNTNKAIAARQAANPGSSGIAQIINGRVQVV